jgi:hypothetical protein
MLCLFPHENLLEGIAREPERNSLFWWKKTPAARVQMTDPACRNCDLRAAVPVTGSGFIFGLPSAFSFRFLSESAIGGIQARTCTMLISALVRSASLTSALLKKPAAFSRNVKLQKNWCKINVSTLSNVNVEVPQSTIAIPRTDGISKKLSSKFFTTQERLGQYGELSFLSPVESKLPPGSRKLLLTFSPSTIYHCCLSGSENKNWDGL